MLMGGFVVQCPKCGATDRIHSEEMMGEGIFEDSPFILGKIEGKEVIKCKKCKVQAVSPSFKQESL